MNKIIFSGVFLLWLMSCTTEKKTKTPDNSPDLFGWTEEKIEVLKRECLERYGKDQQENNENSRQLYCKCFVEKIIYSVKYEQHISPNEESIKLYGEFSDACKELSK